VGKIGLPFDDGEDIVGKELLKLVKDVTREEIDQELTRCPHKETSQKMTDVSHALKSYTLLAAIIITLGRR